MFIATGCGFVHTDEYRDDLQRSPKSGYQERWKISDRIAVAECQVFSELLGFPVTVYSTSEIQGAVKLSPEHTAFRWATKEEILQLPIEDYIKIYFDEHP